MPEVDEFGIPIKNKAVKVSESSSADEFGIPIKPKAEQPPVKKKSTVSPWQSIIPTVETPNIQNQPQSSTGQVAPLDLFKAGLEKSQSSSAPDLRSGARLPGIEPNANQRTAPEKINTSLDQEVGKINSFMEGYDYKAERAAERKDMGIVSKKPTNADLRTDPRTPKLVYNNNEYRTNTLSDGTESWEKRDKLSGDFFVISDPNSITLLNKKFGGEVPTENKLFEETRKSQLERRQALLPLNQGLIGESSLIKAVPRIKNILANLGVENDFIVEPMLSASDAIEITNKVTGQKQRISLDNWTDERDKQESKVLKSFIESYTYNKDYFKKKKQIDELSVVNENDFNAFDIEGMVEKNKKLNDLKEEVANIEKGRDRFINDNEYRATAEKNVKTEINNYKTKIDQLHIASIDLSEAAKSLNEEKNNLLEFVSAGTISPEEAQARLESIQAREANLQSTKESLSSDLNNAVSRKEFNENVVKDAYLINSERGNILSGTTQAFTRGMEAPFRMILNAYERQTGQKYIGGDKSIFGDDEYGWGAGVSTLDYTKSENRNDFSKAIFGISESLGSALSGYIMTGGAMGLAPNASSVSEKAANLIDLGIFASMYNSSRDQMEGEEWAGVPLEEKVLLSIAIATPQMVLEKFGLTEALRGTNFGRKLTANVLKQVFNEIPKDASTEVVENAIKKNLTKLIGEGVLRANGAGLVEATTEGSQYLSEVSTQELYNLAKGKKFFDTPNSFMGLVENLGENAKIGYIGGASLGAVSSVLSVAREKMTKDDFSKLENTINDVNLNQALTLHIQQQLINNEITQEEADQKLENIQKFEKELAVFPKEMSVDDKYEASNLLAERAKIQAEIEGKEKTLVQDKTNRINEINSQLKEIGNRKQVVTENTTTTRDKTTNTAQYDSDGNLIKNPEDKSKDLFKYDSDGNLIKNTTRTETTINERPTVQIDAERNSSYTDSEGKFYSKEEVAKMSPEALSQLTIVNPSPEVKARIEEVFPVEKAATKETIAPTQTTSEKIAGEIESKKSEITDLENQLEEEKTILQPRPIEVLDENGNIVVTSDNVVNLENKIKEKKSELTSLEKSESDPDLNDMDPMLVAARNGDVEAQKEFERMGLDWEQSTTYRFAGQSEVDVLLANEKVESKRGIADNGIDVTSSPNVTTAADSEYRITFKESFDKNNGLGKVRKKNDQDSNLQRGRGYSLDDVAKIEKVDENGNVTEVVYDQSGSKSQKTTENLDGIQKTVAQLEQEKIESRPLKPLSPDADLSAWEQSVKESDASYDALIEEAKKNEDNIKKELYPKYKEAKSRIKNKELFRDGGVFANELGGSGENSIPTNHTEINGIEFVQFSNPDTGIVDVIMTGTSDNDFVGYYRLYENGKPTNKWSSKFENQSRNKANFKTMISGVQSMLPKGHEYTEKTSISTDGLRVWNQQLDKGYEVQQDKDGNVVTNRVSINGDAISNELGIEVSQGNFSNISVTNNKQFETVKKAITPYLEKLGLTSDNIYWENGTVTIDLPVLKQQEAQKTSEKSAEKTITKKEEKSNQDKTDDEIEKRMAEIEEIYDGIPSQFQSESDSKEYVALEKEMEKRERASVFDVPLEKVSESVDALIKKEKEMPNGFGSFIEKRDARETKEVADRYLSPEELSDKEVMDDFSDALRGNPTTWYADGLKLRESANEASKRGISFEDLLKKVKRIYTSEGYSEKQSEDVVKMFIKPIFEGAEKTTETQKQSEAQAKLPAQETKQTGVKEVQDNAKEYKEKYGVNKNQRTNEKVSNVFDKVSKKIADLYQSIKHEPKKEEVKKAYDALVKETKDQYNFIVSKGLKVVRHQGKGEPYASSADMLNDLRDNNTLVFLPNDEAFGQKGPSSVDNIGLEPSGIKLEDGYELTNSEVFRVVHDYFGHGILGNQFGAIGEENATLQHLDLYTQEALPAVIFQTRGQNSWVNFSGENDRANKLREQARELVKQGKTEEAKKLSDEADDIFKFAEPKINILPKKFNFKRHETARRISEQESIDRRPNKRNTELPGLLARYSKENRKTRGISKKSVRRTQRIGEFSVNIVAEYTLDDKIDKQIKITSPQFKGVQTIYEITDGNVYREMLIKSLEDNPHSASVTVHSAEEFGNMRMFITEDGSTGVTLTKEGFLGGGFSMSRPQNLPQLLILGIKEGATTAEAFDTILPDYYTSFGFKAVSRTAFNHKYRPLVKNGNAVKDWDYETYKKFNNGRPDIVFFIYDGGDRNTIEDRVGLFDGYQKYEKALVKSFDKNGYDQAQEVMNQEAVKRLEFESGVESTAPAEQKSENVKEEEKPTTETTSEEMVMPGENQKRRDEGKFTKDGVEYVRNEPTENVRGKEGEVRFTESTKEGFTYKLVEAEELQPSHQNGQRNPMHFIPEAQPKSRTDVGSIAAEQSFANNPRFDSLGQDQDAYSGAPVVNERNEVVQGNNRSAGLKKGYNQGSTQYKQDLASNAKKFGFTKEQVEGMKNPILVREIKVDDDKAIELGNYDVKDMETGGKSRIDAVALSRRIPLNARQQITDLLFKDDNVTLNESIRKNQAKVTEILRKYLNQAQRTSLSKDGELTKNAISDIEELVKQFLFDGADTQLSDVFENLPKTVQEGVRKSMPYIFGVDFNNSILSDVQNGLIALNQFIASGIKDFGEWKNQQDMFNDGKTPVDMFSPLAVAIAEKLNSSKQTEIVGYFKKYAAETKGTEADMFNQATEGKTKEQATKDIFGESSTEKKSSSVKQAPKKTEKPAEKETEKSKFKSVADNIRKLKSEPKKFIDPITGKEFEFTKQGFDWNDMVEAVAIAVEKTGDLVGAVKDYLKKQDWYSNLSDEQQKSLEDQIINELDPESNTNQTEPSKPKGENTSRQSERAIEMQEDENPELAKRIKSLSSYERQDQKEFFDNVSSIIDDMGEVAAVDFATNPSNNVPVEVREAILTIAAARYGSSAMEKQNRAIESNDDQLLAEAEYELEKSMLWNLEASQYATKAGQIIAFKNKIYNEFPAFFSLSKKKEFDNKFGAEQEVKEEIKGLQDDISRGVDSIVDDLTTNKEIEALKAQVEELQSKLANSKNSEGSRSQKSDEKIKEIKQRRKDLFAQLKNESRGGQVSASIGFMNSNQIELIGKIVASYIEEGIVRTDKIVNEIYRNLKDSYPALRKEHIRSIARENPDFETLQNSEAQVKEKTKLEKLQEKLAKLQKGEGEITETVNRDDSDEVKQVKKQIEEEKILSPKVLRQLVKDYLRGNKMNYRSLADAIAKKSGKSIEEVQDLADLMEEKIRVKVEELVKKEHKKFIEKTNSSAEKTKTKDLKYRKQKGIATEEELAELDRRLEDQRSKSEIKRIMQTIMMGGLGSSSDFRKAFEERFGFKELSETTQKQVDALAFEIFDIQREVDKQVVDSEGKTVALNPLRRQRLAIVQKKLNTLLESNKPWTVGKVLKEIISAIYIHILSGPTTFARAFIGGYVSGGFGFGAYNFINIKNYKSLARGYKEMIKALPAAYIKAVQSRKTGVDFFGATGLSGEIGGDTFGAYESAIFKGLNDAMKNKETGKVLIKSYGQALKVIHALGALDTFMNTITGTFVGTVEASKRGEFNKINDSEYKEIANQEWSNFVDSIDKLVHIQSPDLDFDSKIKKADSIIRQELGITGSRYDSKKVFTANRIQELRENNLGKYFEQGVSLSKDASMMGKPDGLTGVLVDKLQKASTISDTDNTVAASLKVIPNFIFKFTRITGQVINKSFNNIPLIGIANAAVGVGRNMETGEFEYGFLQRAKSNPLLFRQRVATNLLTTATLIGAYALMFDDDDEEGLKLDENRPFDLRGFGGDKQVTDRKYENYRNLSISFTKDKNGKWTNYVELKLVPEMSAIAGMLGYFGDVMKGDVKLSSDDQVQKVLLERFKKEGLSTRNIFKAMSENTKIFTESSFSSVGSISRNYKSGEQDGGFMGGIGNVALNLMVDNIKPLVEPRVVESVIKTVSKVNGSEEKELKDWEYFAKNLYGLDSFFSDNKTDVFGNTYKKESDYEKFMKDTFGVGKKRSEDFKDVALLYKFEQGANISKRKFTEMKPDSKEGFTVTYNSPFGKVTKKYLSADKSIVDETQLIQESEFKRLVSENYKSLNSIDTKDKLEKRLKELQDKSTEYAKKEIVKKYDGTKKIESIDK